MDPTTELGGYSAVSSWLTDAGLYQCLTLNRDELNQLVSGLIERSGFRVDCYCPDCRDSSVFSLVMDSAALLDLNTALAYAKLGHRTNMFEWIRSNLSDLTLICAREDNHRLRIFLEVQESIGAESYSTGLQLTKIGQSPSKFDLLRGDLVKYRKIAGEIDGRELQSAAMCHAHGLHVAAFVYLRRVFERRIEIAHQQAREDPSWDEGQYEPRRMRMDEQISLLSHHLPPFLVQNRGVYKILSKGVHELTEEECEAAYQALETGVGLILDEEIERRERNRKQSEAAASIRKLSEKFSS